MKRAAILFVAIAILPSIAAPSIDVARERARVLKASDQYLKEAPITITASRASRSAGGLHDYFSEGDYWWPDPKNPDGPYIQRDGQSNPANFDDHRKAMRRLSVQVPALVAAWTLTHEARYAQHAAKHLRAWFITPATRMNPHLRYSQAIHGITSGRSIGIIDTIHLVEVARAIERLDGAPGWTSGDARATRAWFAEYLEWLTKDPFGIQERDATNNHGTCWVMQAAAFAHLTGNTEVLQFTRDRFKTVLVPNHMAADGSFPRELGRTKPYGYSLFNLDAMATIAQILSTPEDNLWTFELADGRGMRRAMEYMVPFIRNKKSWPKPPDVMFDTAWPMRQPSLLFAGIALNRPDYVDLWSSLPADSDIDEVIRNFFIRQPLLWIGASPQSLVASRESGAPAGLKAHPTDEITSPGGQVAVDFWLDAKGLLQYSVSLDGRPVIEPSAAGIVIDGVNLGEGAERISVMRSSTNREYPTRGVHSVARGRSNDARIAFRHRKSGIRFAVDVRAFDDGVAFRYLDHEAKEVVDHYEAILRDAAEFHLMVNFHGANKPTGGDRTWPHELTREGVYGLEHRNTEAWGPHDATVPFTRYLAGAGDFTPVVFGVRRKETSWAHQIATAVLFTSPLLVDGGHPQSLLENPAVDVIKSIPSVWDETVVLPGSESGEVAAMARRHGKDWFVAIVNGAEARQLKIPATFLRSGRYASLVVRDDTQAPVGLERGDAGANDVLTIDLRPGGGFVARFTPAEAGS